MKKRIVKTNSANETFNFGVSFADEISCGDIICMYGDLGVGKTVFVQGLAKGLEIDDYISSPTFNIVNTYKGKKVLNHFDAYRIGDSDEMLDIGFEEYVDGDSVSVIEWAELIEDIIPERAYKITIERGTEDDSRIITIEQ